nr:SUMF1/EgtB/PvdO family nonheme iron enzyme [Myxococcales bacterium]
MHASTFMRVSIPIAIILTGLSVYSCVETIDPPPPTVQGQVAIPERIYVRARSDSRICSRLFDGDVPVDGGADEPPVDTAYNCYFNVSPPDGGSLPVDVHEVTNLQYQLCYDSGACRGPNPADVDKGAVCQSEDSFDQCPVVGVTYQQAQDYCEWVGRRLPTNLEQILIRQVGLNTKDQNFPLEVPILPTNEPIPQVCSDGVIANGGCNRPFPVMSGDVVPIKA